LNDTITAYRTCPLCEATCGLELTIEDGTVSRIRGDAEDVFSHGFVCPKGAALKPLHEDSDRVRAPLLRAGSGFEEVSWEDAFGEIERRLTPIVERHGRDAIAAYLGNPNAHNLDALISGRVALRRSARGTSSPPPPWTRCPSTCPPGTCSGPRSASPCRTWTARTT